MRGKVLPRPGSLGAWVLAIRPKTLTASVMPVVVGSTLGWELVRTGRGHPFTVSGLWLRMLGALVVGLGIQIGTNLVNDWADHLKGADTHERLGPPRVTNLGLLSQGAVLIGAGVSFGLAAVSGAWLLLSLHHAAGVSVAPALVLGALALCCGVLYTVGPVSIAYLGLGELFVLGFFGIFATAGTTFALTGAWTHDAIVLGVSMGLLAVGILQANNIRDIPTDEKAGKRTLQVRLGERGSRILYAFVIAAAFVATFFVLPPWGVLVVAVVSGYPASKAVFEVMRGARGRELIHVLQANSLAELLFGIAVSFVIVAGKV
jgi:1,4-dihydroxy-2-naphthoate octaprenyltransferase